jgi:hypothetical protein
MFIFCYCYFGSFHLYHDNLVKRFHCAAEEENETEKVICKKLKVGCERLSIKKDDYDGTKENKAPLTSVNSKIIEKEEHQKEALPRESRLTRSVLNNATLSRSHSNNGAPDQHYLGLVKRLASMKEPNLDFQTAVINYQTACKVPNNLAQGSEKAKVYAEKSDLANLHKDKYGFLSYAQTEEYQERALLWKQFIRFSPKLQELTEKCFLLPWANVINENGTKTANKRSMTCDAVLLYVLLRKGEKLETIVKENKESKSFHFLSLLKELKEYLDQYTYQKDSKGELIIIDANAL